MNSSGNIIGVIPKNFIIVLIENHHFVDVNQLDSYQKSKLPKMFRRSSSDLLADEMGPGGGAQDDSWFHEKDYRDEADQSNQSLSLLGAKKDTVRVEP